MTLAECLALIAVMLPMALMPSASVALVIARTLSHGRSAGLLVATGIV